MPKPNAKRPWTEGDILYLKDWDENTRKTYEKSGVTEEIAGHPAVLLHRSSPSSEHIVVALMTSLRGRTLAEHSFIQAKPGRSRAYVPVSPSPKNPDNPLYFYMTPKACVKPSYINTSSIFSLPGKVMQRFADKGGTDYALSRKAMKKLTHFLKDDRRFIAVKAVAAVQDQPVPDSPMHVEVPATSQPQQTIYERVRTPQQRSSDQISNHPALPVQLPQVILPPSTSVRASTSSLQHRDPLPWPAIPGSYPTSPAQDHFTFYSPQHASPPSQSNRTLQAAAGRELRYPAAPAMERGLSERSPLLDPGKAPHQDDSDYRPRTGVLLLAVGVVTVGLGAGAVWGAVKGAEAAAAAAVIAWNGMMAVGKEVLSELWRGILSLGSMHF